MKRCFWQHKLIRHLRQFISHNFIVIFRLGFLTYIFLLFSISGYSSFAFAHGFNADYVKITRLINGKYRVIISYTNIEIGEFREAYIDFTGREEAIKVYWDLAKGADFFLGEIKKTIHFHDQTQKNLPY